VKIKNLLAGVAIASVTVTGAATISACSPAHAVSYAPASYGEYYGGHWHCYYVHDYYEYTQLVHAGHCHAGDIATLMPLYWHERYYGYYSGVGYTNHFVLPSYRTTYVNVQVNQFGRTYRSQIQSQSRSATWKSSKGRTYSGTQVKPKFTTGTKGRSFGGGSSRSRTSTGSGRTGQGSRSTGGRSFGGGTSRRSTGGGFGGSSGRSFGGGSSRRR
jgi:hypothetical protein